MFRPWLVATACLLTVATQARAQSRWEVFKGNLKNSAGDAWDVWTSPLRGTGRDWIEAAGVVGGAAAVSPFDDNVDRWAFDHQDDNFFNFLDPLRSGGVAFSGKTITPVAVGALAASVVVNNQRLQEGIFGCATSYAASSIVRTFVVYPLVSRRRPVPDRDVPTPPASQGDQYHFGVPGSGDWGEHSLPGGHLGNITACVTYLNTRYHMGRVVEPVLWATVAGVSVARVLDRAHWTSDQVLGAFFGYAVGREVALRSSRREQKRAHEGRAEVEAPSSSSFFVSPGLTGTRLGWQRTF